MQKNNLHISGQSFVKINIFIFDQKKIISFYSNRKHTKFLSFKVKRKTTLKN